MTVNKYALQTSYHLLHLDLYSVKTIHLSKVSAEIIATSTFLNCLLSSINREIITNFSQQSEKVGFTWFQFDFSWFQLGFNGFSWF